MKLLVTALLVLSTTTAIAQQARDQLRIVGSSTVFPFTTTVAENYSRTSGKKAPIVESTGTGGGIKLFCAGIGVQHPDMVNASRAITQSERAQCANNGVTQITELLIGYDGIVFTVKKGSTSLNLSKQDIWLALARQVPVNGVLSPNPYKSWKEVNAKLPDLVIEVMGPPPTSGTRDALVEMVMDEGCKSFSEVKNITDNKARQQVCGQIREDGRYIEAGENDNLIVQRLVAGRPGVIGIFGFSFLEENLDKLQGIKIGGVEPTFESISDQSYSVARPLFVYIKNGHAQTVPGFLDFIKEYVSARSMGTGGYLEKKGLIPLPSKEFEQARQRAVSLVPLP